MQTKWINIKPGIKKNRSETKRNVPGKIFGKFKKKSEFVFFRFGHLLLFRKTLYSTSKHSWSEERSRGITAVVGIAGTAKIITWKRNTKNEKRKKWQQNEQKGERNTDNDSKKKDNIEKLLWVQKSCKFLTEWKDLFFLLRSDELKKKRARNLKKKVKYWMLPLQTIYIKKILK